MMKIRKYILAGLFILVITSCSDWLDIKPESETVLEDFWNTERDVEQVVATCYREMQEDAFIKSLIVWGELRSENFIEGKDTDDHDKQLLLENILPSNNNNKWEKFYSVINFCNTVLHYGPLAAERDPNFTSSALEAKNAEVITIRALCYFYLVRAFKYVPYVEEPSIDDTQTYEIAQISDIEILSRLIEDLQRAENNAVNAYAASGYYNYNKGRVTKNAVRALLADIFLWMASLKDHTDECGGCRLTYLENCIAYCDLILNDKLGQNSRYELEMPTSYSAPYYSIFGNGNSAESIFELQFQSGIKDNSNISNLYGNYKENAGKLAATNILNTDAKLFGVNTTDLRRYDSFLDKEYNGKFYIFKYTGLERWESTNSNNEKIHYYSYRSSAANWIIYRLPEIMLIKAEALTLLNRNEQDLHDALELVNAVNRRSNVDLVVDPFTWDGYGNQSALEELVLEERHREFLFEGKRWFDLLRYALRSGDTSFLADKVVRKQTSNQATIKNKFKDIDALYLPIHDTELKANSKLFQNPFYEYISSTSNQ